jgi:multiple sugar transport system ATP-binding protein
LGVAEVNIKNVWKIYGKTVEAVKGLNLDVKDGEFVSLLGPSGCGKSSTLRMVAGLEEITEGDLFIGDRRVNDLEPGERDVAMVFENYALLPHMTAYENIAFPLILEKAAKSVIDKKVREISKLLDMDDMLQELAASLGGGERQRVGIGRALIRNSSVLLMDEPISHLDAALRAKTRGELARLQKVLGITTLYVTHDQLEALAMSDRIAVMNFGDLQQFGTPDELYNHPQNLFVAKFIGEPPMNLIPCTLQRNDAQVCLLKENGDSGFNFAMDAANAERIVPEFRDGDVLLGVRPLDIKLAGPDSKNCVAGIVSNFEPGCEHSIIEVNVAGADVLVQCSPDNQLKEGDTIDLDLISSRFHLFDADTENSVLANNATAR